MGEFLTLLKQNLGLCVPPIKKCTLADEPLSLSEVHVHLKGEGLTLLRRNPSQDGLRFQQFVELLKSTMPFVRGKLDCEFILNMYEGIYEPVTAARFAYTAKPNAGHILIPDSHCFEAARKVSQLKQADIRFSDKKRGAIFGGSDTGSRHSDGWTMRSLVSATYKNSPLIKSKLTYLDNDTEKRLAGKVDVVEIYSPPIGLEEQLGYQIILNINGNSTSWERLLWAMASNSLCVFVKPFDGEEMYSWYYPLMESLGVCPYVEYDRLEEFIYNNDFSSNYWQNKIEQQKTFAKFVSSIDTQTIFLARILEEYNNVYNS